MIKDSNKIYFIGIGGIGMSAIARLCLGMGKMVFGSDMRDSQTVQDLITLGASIKTGHDIKNVESVKPDLVIYSEDISSDALGYVELSGARKNGVAEASYAQALGDLMQGQYGVTVTGTNGKSTTTAMLGLILEAAGMDPSVVIGSKLSPKNISEKFLANARLGRGKYFVAEGDEYHRHMLEQKPNMIVITNVAEDHLDYYRDIDEIKGAFAEFVKNLPTDGVVVYNADDHNTIEVGRMAHCHKFTYGIHHYADLQAVNLNMANGQQTFDLHLNDQMIGSIRLRLPGLFNVANALGASLAALKLGVDFATIKSILENFAGIWRRFEVVGKLDTLTVISDYAHHPDAVAGTIQAAKDFYPGKKILFVFQPHHRNRTKKLFGEFVEALTGADDLILPEIFDVAGREHGENVSSRQLVEELVKAHVRVSFCRDLQDTETLIKKQAKDFDVIVMMGAGDIDLLARKLVDG